MNRLLILLFWMVTFAAHAQVPDYVPTEGLLAWYGLNGDGTDASDYQRHAFSTATQPADNRFGEANAALAFGSAAETETSHVIIPGLVHDVVNTFSYAFWANPLMNIPLPNQGGTGTEGNTNNCLLHPLHGHFFGTDSLHTGAGVHLGQNGIVISEHSDAFVAATLVEQTDLSDWHHYVVVYDDGIPSLFLDGEFVKFGVATIRDTHISLGTDPWYPTGGIGNGYNDLSFNGSIDDFGFWSRALNSVDVAALFTNQVQVFGCTDSSACNFNEQANQDDGSCVYPLFGDDCETGSAACGEGTVWDSASQSCLAWNDCPSDLDGDGIVGVNDLLALLADFGTECPPEVAEWTCGDPVDYHGYDYATVQIGEQCWFAENLKTEQYQNGDSIPGDLSSAQWTNTVSGAQAVYGDDEGNLDLYGRLYNGYAMADARALCPTNWHVPSDEDWGVLEIELGLDESELLLIGERGDDEGTQLKASTSDTPSWDGSNTSGFSAVANGYRHNHGYYQHLNFNSHYWTQTASDEGVFYIRTLQNSVDGIIRLTRVANSGYTVRCVAD